MPRPAASSVAPLARRPSVSAWGRAALRWAPAALPPPGALPRLCCALVFLASPAFAQDARPLAPVDVPLPPAAAEPSSASPARRDPTATTTVIEARRPGEVKDAAELVTEAPGAAVQDAGGAGQRKTLSLRGAAPNGVLVLLDGVPLGGPGTSVDLSRVPAALLERLEVLRGGASARYGPGAMGGVVNLVTRAPDGSRLFGEVTQGSFATTLASAGGSATLLGGEGLVLLHGLRSDGSFTYRFDDRPELPGAAPLWMTRANNQALQGGGLLRYRAALGPAAVDVLAEGLAEQRGLAGTVQNPTPDASQTTLRATGSARLRWQLDGGGEVSALAWARADDLALHGGLFGAAKDFRQLESGAGAEVAFTRLFAGRHGVTALLTGGGDWLREPTGKNPSQGRLGAMAGDEVQFFDGRLTVDGSARVDLAGRDVVFSPKLGAAVQLPWGFELKANAGQASRPPSFVERYVMQGNLVPNPGLRPERALTGDLTVAWKHALAALGVTGFYSLYEDLISYEYYPPMLAKPFNFSAARVAGVELEATARPKPWLELSASYTYLDTQNLRDDPRYYLKPLPFRPNHRLAARVAGGLSWLRGHADVVYQSGQYTNRTATVELPARALVSVGLSTTPLKNPAVTLAFEVKNLLDVQAQDVDGYPLPPRAAYLSLAVAWDAAQKVSP